MSKHAGVSVRSAYSKLCFKKSAAVRIRENMYVLV